MKIASTVQDIINELTQSDILINAADEFDYLNLPLGLEEGAVEWWCGSDKIAFKYNDKCVAKVSIMGTFVYEEGLSQEDYDEYIKEGYTYKELDEILIKGREKNPCYDEFTIYEEACNKGLDVFFAQEELENGILFQEKVTIYGEDNEFWNKYNNVDMTIYLYARYLNLDIPKEVLAALYECYGDDCDKFLTFLSDNKINDLSYHNWGFRENGTICVFDFCGWERWV